MMAAIQMNNDKGQVTQLFSSPERDACLDEGKVNDVSMHVQELPSEKCDTTSKNEENGLDEATEEDGEEAEVRRGSSSVLEAKERAHNFLRDELQKAQQELKLKDKECQKLHQVQEKMGEELEELTASLFEEANKMVQDANIRRMQAEKLLKEANAKIDILQAEVTALKTLVITSTPSMPNKHLHPQLEPKKDEFVKGHRRSTSHHNFSKEMRMKEVTFLQEAQPQSLKPVQWELDPVCFEEFRCWKVMPMMAQSCDFLSHIISEDVLPCLGFANRELARSVFECVMDNSLTIEPVPDKHPSPGLPQSSDDPSCKCALVNSNCACKYRIKLDDSQQWYFISQLARNRITAVCDFMTYIRYITQGLVKSDVRDMYWEIIRLRQQMALARLGLS